MKCNYSFCLHKYNPPTLSVIKSLVNILSIKVVEYSVIRLGLSIRGYILKLNIVSTNFFVFLCLSWFSKINI